MLQNRRIVTGIDFSQCSLNALKYAAALCDFLKMSLVLVHGSHAGFSTGESPTSESPVYGDTRVEMDKVVTSIRDKFPHLQIMDIVEKANPTEAIIIAAERFAPELIVVGTQGIHESPETFIGGTTGALIKIGKAPVLAVPVGSTFTPYEHILFAVKNPYVASKQVLLPLFTILESTRSALDLLYVTGDSMPDLSRFPDPYLITPHTDRLHTSESNNIYHSVQKYLETQDADLLVVISRLRGFFDGLFAQSSAGSSMFNSKLPILVLNGGTRI